MPSPDRTFDARPDTTDFRDKLYTPALIEVRPEIRLAAYQQYEVPVLDQGTEGACTGFALAATAHYLMRRLKGEAAPPLPADEHVSPHMFYETAKRYDEWPGESYEGSSARGAMKAWHKHGVCALHLWPGPVPGEVYDRRLTNERVEDAARRPLGAYFRVNHKDLVSMHSAITEVGLLYATALVHEGWDAPEPDGTIPYKETYKQLGGHAFVIVAYDAEGFWIQNSWGTDWGTEGFGRISYDDWLLHGSDVWVARLGAPVALRRSDASAVSLSAAAHKSAVYSYCELRGHVISVGNEGTLRTSGTYGTSEDDVQALFTDDLPRAFTKWGNKKKRLLLYAHGGLVPEKAAVQRVADYRSSFLDHHVYPLAFVWKTDYWTTLTNMLQDALRRRRTEGILDRAKDFMLDRLDDAIEPLARTLTGKASWDEMKENALTASKLNTRHRGAAALACEHIIQLVQDDPSVEIHIAAHSAGSIFMAPVVTRLTEADVPIVSCTLWAPACTFDLFRKHYAPAIVADHIHRFALFTLTDDAERDDHCAHVYHKSLLYLVSHAFEKRPRIPLFQSGEPILGMARWIKHEKGDDAEMAALFARPNVDWVESPNPFNKGAKGAARAMRHGDFDDDEYTLQATLARILAQGNSSSTFALHRSETKLRDRRQSLDRVTPENVLPVVP